MPTVSDRSADRDEMLTDAAAANEAIRRYVRAHGSRPWTESDRAELHRLQVAWLAAVRTRIGAAA